MVGSFGSWTPSAGETLVTAIDEEEPDEANFISTTAAGNKVSFTFEPITGTWNVVTTLRIRFQVIPDTTFDQELKISALISGTEHLLSTVGIAADADEEPVLLTVDVNKNPETEEPWTFDEINSLEIILEKGDGQQIGGLTQDAPIQNLTIQGNSFSVGDGTITTESLASGIGFHSAHNIWLFFTGHSNDDSPCGPGTGFHRSYTWSSQLEVFRLTVTFGIDPDFNGLDPTVELRVLASKTVLPIPPPDFSSFPGGPCDHMAFNNTFAFAGGPNGLSVFQLGNGNYTYSHTVEFQLENAQAVVGSIRLVRSAAVTNNTAPLKVSWLRLSVTGEGAVDVRNLLLLGTSKSLLTISEDLLEYTDITNSLVFTAPETSFWDYKVFQDELYITNGTDQLVKVTDAVTVEQLSGKPTGKCLSGYGRRLWLGDVTESGLHHPSQVRWSSIDDTDDWSTTGGNLELDETAGSVVRIRPVAEPADTFVGVLVAYKTEGIYHIYATGISNDPFAKKLMDGATGCLAPASLQEVVFPDGRARHIFLGQIGGAGGSVNVLTWDGNQATPIGFEIVPLLEELGDSLSLSFAVSTLDPVGNYILSFPPAGSTVPSITLAYNIQHRVWSRWAIGNVPTLGRWVPTTGPPVSVLARGDSKAYAIDPNSGTDDFVSSSGVSIPAVLETGDLALGDSWKERVLERLWLYYKEGSQDTSWEALVSVDGGVTFTSFDGEPQPDRQFLSASGGRTRLQQFNLRATGRKHRVRLTSPHAGGRPELLQMILETEEAGHDHTTPSEVE